MGVCTRILPPSSAAAPSRWTARPCSWWPTPSCAVDASRSSRSSSDAGHLRTPQLMRVRAVWIAGTSDFLETVAPHFREQVAVTGQGRGESLGVSGRLVHLFLRQISVTVVQQPGYRVSLESHPVEDVLIARRREHFFTVCEVFMPRAMVPPEFQVLAQAVRNRFASSVVAPEPRVDPSTQHVVQLEEIDNTLPAITKS